MSSSAKTPSGYSFRQGSVAELQAHHSKYSGWVIILISILAIVVSIRTVLEAFVKRLEINHKAYLFEYGKPPNHFFDWQIISSAIKLSDFLVFLSMGSAVAFGIAIYKLSEYLMARSYTKDKVWFVEYEKQIVGWAFIVVKTNYNILSNIYIEPKHRSQGVGSQLLWHCLENLSLPVYLIYIPYLKSFYEKFGFVSLPNDEKPRELKFSPLPAMVLLQPPIPISEQQSTSFPLPPGISIRPFQNFQEQWQIYQTFWQRQRFRKSLIYIATIITALAGGSFVVISLTVIIIKELLGLTWLAEFDYSVLDLPVSGIAIAIWLISLFFILNRFVFRWQELLIEKDKRPIGYIHFGKYNNYSMLFNLHIEAQYQPQEMTKLILARIQPQITLPLYCLGWRRDKQFYNGLGFISAHRQELPLEFRIIQLSEQVYFKLTSQGATNISNQLAKTIAAISAQQTVQPANIPVKKSRDRKWFLIGDAVIFLVIYMLTPLWQIPQIYANSQPQTPKQDISTNQPAIPAWKIPEHIGVLAIAPDNQTLVSGNWDNKIQVWDINKKSLQQTLSVFSGKIQSIAVSPDNQSLVVGTSTGIIQKWDYKSGTLDKTFYPAHLGEVKALNISADAQILVTGSPNDPTVKVWNLADGNLLQKVNSRGYVFALAISKDNQNLYIASLGGVKIWDLRQQKFVQSWAAHSREVEVIALSPDGKFIVTGGSDRQDLSTIWMVKVWDAQTLKLLKTLPGYSTFLTSLTVTPDSQTIIFNDCCSTNIWNWQNNKYISSVDGLKHNAVLIPDSLNLIGAASDRQTITIKDLNSILQLKTNK
ncbi:GNAT family N-acetyltransferase [Calothrix sp. FACHB-1219]|uniref:GNAT family N-acetyltransferase n=1 Tax=unclassified Calothrix TaxID=2619626 RepID=UPI0016828FD3|nr:MULTISPECIES: GNAT family N-acetyltransferase [unclassified Calothrix]MBD2206897.1 GNAT family N-acetyltransferase [Calothrix sp. FACHB-168]MBD2221515.1 GNAT family N-acetyltransferase [Calothrix sp. FACHB-1219]